VWERGDPRIDWWLAWGRRHHKQRWWLVGSLAPAMVDTHWPESRAFTSWDEVRVALDEVEERGSWWPDP
jgi:hypothetical protein